MQLFSSWTYGNIWTVNVYNCILYLHLSHLHLSITQNVETPHAPLLLLKQNTPKVLSYQTHAYIHMLSYILLFQINTFKRLGGGRPGRWLGGGRVWGRGAGGIQSSFSFQSNTMSIKWYYCLTDWMAACRWHNLHKVILLSYWLDGCM